MSLQKLVLPASCCLMLALLEWTLPAASVTQYHEQGVHGLDSYKYGFETGDDHQNPQERHEERDAHGNVKGHFSYLDGTGHKVTVHYKADKHGFHRSDDPASNPKNVPGHKHHSPPSHHHSHQYHAPSHHQHSTGMSHHHHQPHGHHSHQEPSVHPGPDVGQDNDQVQW